MRGHSLLQEVNELRSVDGKTGCGSDERDDSLSEPSIWHTHNRGSRYRAMLLERFFDFFGREAFTSAIDKGAALLEGRFMRVGSAG
jgi:hypothetical protein